MTNQRAHWENRPAERQFKPQRDLPRRELVLTKRTLLAFLIGCCAPFPVRFVGVLFVGEVVLLLIAGWVVATRLQARSFWSKAATRFAALLCIALAGYIISDIFRETAPEDFVRGWSKVGFLATDFIGLYYLSKKNAVAIPMFFIGYNLGCFAIASLQAQAQSGYALQFYWKFFYAVPLTVIPLSLLMIFARSRIRVTAYFLGVIGAVHILFDYRSLGLICLVVASMLLAATRKKSGSTMIDKRVWILSAVAVGGAFTYLYFAGQTEFGGRRDASNSWRYGTTVALVKGIMRSPLIGNGSWSSDPELEAWRDEAMEARGVNRYAAGKSDRFTGHSEVFQAWFEGGILTLGFFVFYGFQLVNAIRVLFTRKLDNMSALFLFWMLAMLWGYCFDPFNGLVRVEMACALAILCFMYEAERRVVQQAIPATYTGHTAYWQRPARLGTAR